MRKIKEYLHISQPAIDITDPCYDSDVWCRMNNMPIEEGNYEVIINQYENDRNHSIILIKGGLSVDDVNIQEVYKGSIGVDAGLAGFLKTSLIIPTKNGIKFAIISENKILVLLKMTVHSNATVFGVVLVGEMENILLLN